MAGLKIPELKILGDMAENFKNFELRFEDYCIQKSYRDSTKCKNTEQVQHYKAPTMEISALRTGMPDEVLQIIRYTIEPQIPEADKKKPWIWMEKLREHYIGTSVNSVMSDRFKFWSLSQVPNESVQDWENRCRQSSSLCQYEVNTDEMCRDKFVFGLKDRIMRTELLKSHLRSDNTKKSMNDVVAEAKTLETAKGTNELIEKITTEEQVNWTDQGKKQIKKKRHNEMKLKREQGTCHWCGDRNGYHYWNSCPAKGKICTNCGGNDHFARVCLETSNTSNNTQRNFIRGRGSFPRNRGGRGYSNYNRQSRHDLHALEDIDDTDDSYEFQQCYTLHQGNDRGHKYFVNINMSLNGIRDRLVKLQVDTASTCNTISAHQFRQLHPRADEKLQRTPYLLYPYGNAKPIQPLGQASLECTFNGQHEMLRFQVLPDDIMQGKPALLSGSDSEKLGIVKIRADEIHALPAFQSKKIPLSNDLGKITRVDIMTHYEEVFHGLGILQPPVHFKLKGDITPVQMPIHRVPVSKRAKEKEAIERYVEEGILQKVDEPTPWVSNELIRETEKKFRICIDPSQTINKAILRPIYQMPTLNEQLHKLSKAKVFSVIDVKDGFLHIPLDEESSMMTTMHTSYGRYRWLRLGFGINSGPEEFQMRLLTAFEGLQGIIIIADDVLVFGEGETIDDANKDHDKNLIELLERCIEKNIKLNKNKFQFRTTSLKFVGHILSANGVQADPGKITAVMEMPAPKTKSELLRFIGMVNYLSPFCKNLSNVIAPLRSLTRQDMSYIWSKSQEEAFQETKRLISSAPVLMYYDLNKPVTLQVDASENGLGGSLLQPNSEGELQPVAFVSNSMSKTEQKYSQIEKECLAICNCFAKFDQWLYGKKDITVHTDHQPLETIFKKALNKAPARLQKMMMRLQRYNFSVKYKRGKHMYIADTLSRAALQDPVVADVTGFEVFRTELVDDENNNNPRLMDTTEGKIKEETAKDEILGDLYHMIVHGWPDGKSQVPNHLQQFWNYREELTVKNGIVYKGMMVVVPKSMHSEMLQKIHVNHFGAESNIRMAREVLFWNGMRRAIQDMCNACATCASHGKTAPKEPMKSLPIPTRPWEIISQDLFTYQQNHYLVTVCHFSDWIELDLLENTLSKTVITKTSAHFARFGNPKRCHTDNGPQFISEEYKQFAAREKFLHSTSSPYHSQGNGKAEAAVKICKSMLQKCNNNLDDAMKTYRNTPQVGHSYSPAQRMLGRRTKTTLPTADALLKPELIDTGRVVQEIKEKRKSSKAQYDKLAGLEHNTVDIGNHVYFKPPPNRRGTAWAYGEVVKRADRSYSINTPNGMVRRNRVHIRPAAPPHPKELGATAPPESYTRIRHTQTTPTAMPISIPTDVSSPPKEPSPDVSVHEKLLPSTNTGSESSDTSRVRDQGNLRLKRLTKRPSRFADYVMC